MYKVTLVNPNFQQGPKEFNAHYLPYSVGMLWEYAKTSEIVRNNFTLDRFVWRREDIPQLVEELKDNAVVAFSSYIWNDRYEAELARQLKTANPRILIVFGGPQPPLTKPNFFSELCPYIDIMVKTEGEITFQKILEQYATTKLYQNVQGILINNDGEIVDTGDAVRIQDLDILPSPYLSGTFDELMAAHPEVEWNASLETNRGCPYQCTFCDWGSLTYAKVKKFDVDKVCAEIEWMGRNRIGFITVCDANFGIFPDRDKLFAKKIVEMQHKYDSCKNYAITWAKNQRAEVLEIIKILVDEGKTPYALNLSVQSLDEQTLENIKRKNLAMNKVEEVFKACEQMNIPLFTEFILGLPGETLETWKKNYYGLYKAGNHTGITVYQAQMLENAEMNLTQRDEFNIKSAMVYDYLEGNNNEGVLKEGVEVVTSTKDLPADKMQLAQVWSWYQSTFHINGLTNYISRFLYQYYDVEYEEFYEKFYQHMLQYDWIQQEVKRITSAYADWENKGMIDHPPIHGVNVYGWNLLNSTTITMHAENKVQYIADMIRDFMDQHYNKLFTDEELYEQLLKFQFNYTIKHDDLAHYPYKVEYDYDFPKFFVGESWQQPAEYRYEFLDDTDMTLRTFCDKITYHRRRHFGKARIKQA